MSKWLNDDAMQAAYDSEIDRTLAAARRRRQDYFDRLHPSTRSQITEQERETRQEQTVEDEGEIHLDN